MVPSVRFISQRSVFIKADAEPNIDDKKRWWIASKGALYSRERTLLDPAHSDVAAGKLVVVLLSQTYRDEWMEHQLPAKYLESPELASALKTGQAGKLRLTGPDMKFMNASLYFRSAEWEGKLSTSLPSHQPKGNDDDAHNPSLESPKFVNASLYFRGIEWEGRLSTSFPSLPLNGNDATAHNPSCEGPLFARDGTLHPSSPGDGTIKLKAGNRPYNDDEVVAEVKAAVNCETTSRTVTQRWR